MSKMSEIKYSGCNQFRMHSVLVLACILSVCSADVFNYDLYKDFLDPAMCARQLQSMRHQFYEASFRAPEGLLYGNLASLGHFHECLAINQVFLETSIQGKYCLIRSQVTLPIIRIPSLAGMSVSENLTWIEMKLPPYLIKPFTKNYLTLAVCIPKTCTVDDVLVPYTWHPVINFKYSEDYCRLPNDKPYMVADFVAISTLSLLALMTIASTAYDIRHTLILGNDPKQATELYRVCSLYTNTHRLVTFSKPSQLECLNGIRSLSTLWIVLIHAKEFFSTGYLVNSMEVTEWHYKRQAMWISSGDIAVDSFFTMSGLLLVYTSFNKMTQMSMLRGLHWFYLSRYLRLFPMLAAAVLVQATLLHRVADGPGWHRVARQVGNCRRSWWITLLHIENWAHAECVGISWYQSVDLQLYVVSPLVLYWVLGSRRAAWCALAFALFASLSTTFAICVIYTTPISMWARGPSIPKKYNFRAYHYKNTLARSPPFFVGMLFGYILHDCRGQKIKLPKRFKVTCHGLALVVFAYVIYIVHPSMQTGWDNQFADIMNNSFRRSCWSLALCWLIFACVHGYGGPVNWFLSLRLWKFLARISYAMYLFHAMVQLTSASAAVVPHYFSMKTLLASFVTDVVYTVMWAMVACVLVEEPAFTLQRIFLQDGFKSHKK